MFVDKDVANRIAMLRFLMIFGVVVLHTPNYVPLAELSGGVFNYIKAFFQSAVFRTTVPILTFISGYLLYSTNLDQSPMKLWAKKAKTLLVPFLFFNLTILALAYGAQAKAGIKMSSDLLSGDASVWMNAAFGVTDSPINYPLNFLRDLLVVMIVAPLFGTLLRVRPALGLVLVALIFMNNFDGQLVLRNTIPVMFYLGGWAAIGKFNMKLLDKYAFELLVIFLLACAVMIATRYSNTTPLSLAAPFLIWPAASLLVNTKVGKGIQSMSKYSFFLFVVHAPVLMATWIVFSKFESTIPYALYWVVAPFLTAAVVILTHKLAMKVMPNFMNLVLGTKVAKPAPAPQVVPAPQFETSWDAIWDPVRAAAAPAPDAAAEATDTDLVPFRNAA